MLTIIYGEQKTSM